MDGPLTRTVVINGPRSAGIARELKDQIYLNPALELVDIEEDRGLIRTSVRATITGDPVAVNDFVAAVEAAV